MSALINITARGGFPYPANGAMRITNFNTANSNAVAGTAVKIAPAETTRVCVIIQSLADVDVYLGGNEDVSASASSANRGLMLSYEDPFGIYSDPYNSGEIWAITGGGSADLCVVEILAP